MRGRKIKSSRQLVRSGAASQIARAHHRKLDATEKPYERPKRKALPLWRPQAAASVEGEAAYVSEEARDGGRGGCPYA